MFVAHTFILPQTKRFCCCSCSKRWWWWRRNKRNARIDSYKTDEKRLSVSISSLAPSRINRHRISRSLCYVFLFRSLVVFFVLCFACGLWILRTKSDQHFFTCPSSFGIVQRKATDAIQSEAIQPMQSKSLAVWSSDSKPHSSLFNATKATQS